MMTRLADAWDLVGDLDVVERWGFPYLRGMLPIVRWAANALEQSGAKVVYVYRDDLDDLDGTDENYVYRDLDLAVRNGERLQLIAIVVSDDALLAHPKRDQLRQIFAQRLRKLADLVRNRHWEPHEDLVVMTVQPASVFVEWLVLAGKATK